MKYFLDSLAQYINNTILDEMDNVELDVYNEADILVGTEKLYKFCDEYKNRVYSSYEPADKKSFINVSEFNRAKKYYHYITYGVNFKVYKVGIDNLPYRQIDYFISGLYDYIYNIPNNIDDFFIVDKEPLNDVKIKKRNTQTYFCEMLFNYKVDLTTIYNQEIILREE